MRFIHFKPLTEQRLDEINMSPASLRQLASKIEGAKAGLEFELVIKDMSGDDESGESEPDYDSDESCGDIDDICNFFDSGDMNSNGEIRRLREKLESDFYDWQSEQLSDAFADADLPSMLTDYFTNEEGLEGEELEQAVATELDSPGRAYDNVREEWEDDARDRFTEEKWLRREGYRYMSDIENNYQITWPHFTVGRSGGSRDPSDVAASFEAAVGRKVYVSTGYHDYSMKRQAVGDDFYIAEPDSSIESDDDSDSGLEFVSPPLSISDMLLDLKDVVKWCKQGNAYTNESTGLHMNISVPNYSYDNLDFIKLALLMGDEHVSESFGRLGVTYAKSALGIIMKNIQNRPESARDLMEKMKTHLNAAASKAVHSGNTDKYTSINVKDGRVEFRSPGGDWLSDFEDGNVENTLLRFVVALDAAVDETKYKEEYAKKLYKLLAPAVGEGDDTMKYFAQYAAKMMPQAALKSFVKQAQRTRSIKRDIAKGAGGKYWWNVSTVGGRNSIEVVASGEREAKITAASNWGLDVNNPMVYSSYTAKPLRPFDPKDVGDEQITATVGEPEDAFGGPKLYEVYEISTDRQLTTFSAQNEQEALDKMEALLRRHGLGNTTYNLRTVAAGDAARTQTTADNADNWEVYNVGNGETMYQFYAADGVAAVEQQHFSAYSDTNQFRVRPISRAEPDAAEPEQGTWARYIVTNRQGQYVAVSGRNDMSAAAAAFEQHGEPFSASNIAEVHRTGGNTQPRAAELPPVTNRIFWQVTGANGQYVSVPAADEQEAQSVAHRRYGEALGPVGEYEIRRIPS
jgi:hypothetical protein